MARIGIFQVPNAATYQAVASALVAQGQTVLDMTGITSISQIPIGTVDMAIFLNQREPPPLALDLWTIDKIPIFSMGNIGGYSGTVYPIQSSSYSANANPSGFILPISNDVLVQNWSTGTQQMTDCGFTDYNFIITMKPGTAVVAAWNNNSTYLRLNLSPSLFWIHWQVCQIGDASWLTDLVNYIVTHVTSTLPIIGYVGCDPTQNPCPAPYICYDGECLLPCANNQPCPPGTVCQNPPGVCVVPCTPGSCPPPSVCLTNGTCGAPKTCPSGTFIDPATGLCEAPCGPGQPCPSPTTCSNPSGPGFCQTPCTASSPTCQCIGNICHAPTASCQGTAPTCPSGQPAVCIGTTWECPCSAGSTCPDGSPCPTSGYCPAPTGGGTSGGSPWPWIIAVGTPLVWAGAARLHELGKI